MSQPSTDAQMAPEFAIPGYRIVRALASGGMGAVYEAIQHESERRTAIKVLLQGATNAMHLKRFENEVRALGKMKHPGITEILEVGTFATRNGEQPFFSMEFVDGPQIIQYAEDHVLPARARLGLLLKVCEAVQHAHECNIVHRDLKPSNILVAAGPTPKVLDFGVARALGAESEGTPAITQLGELVGTMFYMSPEQVRGDPKEIDARTDIYALGVIGYQLLASRLPYDITRANPIQAFTMICNEEPKPISTWNRTLRGEIEMIIHKALMKKKDERYATAGEMAQDIRDCVG